MTVVVYGSANVDLAVTVDKHPLAGETVRALGAARHRGGGKGVNQAIGASRAGGHETVFIGAVGADAEGDLVARVLQQAGVATVLRRAERESTGMAVVIVDSRGENEVVVLAGANATLVDVTAEEQKCLSTADVLICQGETPTRGFLAAAAVAAAVGAIVVLNPSPVWPMAAAEVAVVDVLVVNETEARLLATQLADAGAPLETAAGASEPSEFDAALAVLGRWFPAVVLTLGPRGARWTQRGEAPGSVPAPRVEVVDTTGAGDTFCGVLAAALAAGRDLPSAVREGVCAASLTATRYGTADAIPHRGEWINLITPA